MIGGFRAEFHGGVAHPDEAGRGGGPFQLHLDGPHAFLEEGGDAASGGTSPREASTQAVPMVGCPAKATSRAGVKILTRHAIRLGGRQDEGGLGEVQLAGDGLHLAVAQPHPVEKHGQRVAAERPLREDADLESIARSGTS